MTALELVMTDTERIRLAKCEATIKDGMTTFVAVGNSLIEVREGKLYRETAKTFESYCFKRWGIKKSNAYRLIEAAEVVEVLSPIGDEIQSESQARELVPLLKEPEKLKAVWADAVESSGGKPTARAVRASRERLYAVPTPQFSGAESPPVAVKATAPPPQPFVVDVKDADKVDPERLLDLAIGIISNAYDGNWKLAPDTWRVAAEQWRDAYSRWAKH